MFAALVIGLSLPRVPAGEPARAGQAASPAPAAQTAEARAAEDRRALAAWKKLEAPEQREALEYLALEARQSGSLQADLLRFALGLSDTPRSTLAEWEKPRWYDPLVTAPAQPIPRRLLPSTAKDVKALLQVCAARAPARRLDCAFFYDYATRSVRRARGWNDPERTLRNALAGFAPDLDLAEALIERALDDGTQQKALTAFAHAYTDRAGGVYPGVTLYDAWASGTAIEMPDVDVLGIVGDVLGPGQRWVAPIPSTQHQELYKQIGVWFEAAHNHRSLRTALARTYLEGEAVLRDQFAPALDNLHALWEAQRSTPAELLPQLPRPEARSDFLAAWTQTCYDKPEIYQAGKARRAALSASEAGVRAIALRVLTEFGAFQRLDQVPKPAAPTSQPPPR